MLLLVRDADQLGKAVESVNDFLAFHRNRPEGYRGPVIGVWLRPELDEDLPAMRCADVAEGKVGLVKGGNGSSKRAASAVKIFESVSISGTWTLCCFEGMVSHSAQGFAAELRTIVDALIVPYSDDRCTFIPVFQHGESLELIRTTMRMLRKVHPKLIAATCFLDDSKRGLRVEGLGEFD